MRRRELITLLGGAAVTWPFASQAQQAGKVYRIGFLANDPTIPTTAAGRAFAEGLRENGFVEGQNIVIERRFMEGEGGNDRALETMAELIRLGPDLIVTSGSRNHLAARQSGTRIPIVMVNANDPVGEGIVPSLASPGGDITGLVQVVSPEFAGKRLQLFKDAVPRIARVAVLMDPDFSGDGLQWTALEPAARSLGIELQPIRVRQGSELRDALATAIRGRPDALFAMNNGLNLTFRGIIVDFAAQNRLPSMHAFAEAVRDGGLISYSANRSDLFRRSATYVAKILKGTKPADLPIEQPTKFELLVNLKTAGTLGLTIPREFLLLADEVIE